MNPNVILLLKRLSVIIVVVVIGSLLYFFITTRTTINLASVFNYLYSIFNSILIISAVFLISSVVMRMVWPGMMRRSETIHLLCLDKNQSGVHLIGSHYYAGGKFSKGHHSYHHYYIEVSSGKMFMSTDLSSEKAFEKSVQDLSQQATLNLHPDTENVMMVGFYKDSSNLKASKSIALTDGRIEIKSFDSWTDFGFRIMFIKNEKMVWRKII